jgi:hypothetical protein
MEVEIKEKEIENCEKEEISFHKLLGQNKSSFERISEVNSE